MVQLAGMGGGRVGAEMGSLAPSSHLRRVVTGVDMYYPGVTSRA